jgi:hypothetical protein
MGSSAACGNAKPIMPNPWLCSAPPIAGRKRAAHPGTAPCRMLPEPWLLVKQVGPLQFPHASLHGQGCGSGMQFSGTIAKLGRGSSNKGNRESGSKGAGSSPTSLLSHSLK